MRRYAIVVERAGDNYSAYVPDLPGCITTGATVDEVLVNIQEAISSHLEAMEELGIPIPEPTTPSEVVVTDGTAHTIEVNV